MSSTQTIRGIVGRVFFVNPESPAMAGVLNLEDGKEVRFAGKVAAQQGDRLEITGEWTTHPKFGRQFSADTGVVKMNDSPEALTHLLATDKRFKGLGPSRADKVVRAALELSDDGDIASALGAYTEEIATRAGCPLDIVAGAAEVWNKKRTYFDALAALCDQGWSNAQAQAIVEKFGENAATIVTGDPYMLIGRVPRFGFRTVDAVAIKMGTKPSDPERLAAGVAYCLDRIGDNGGNTWTTREGLISDSVQELRPDTLDAEIRIEQALDRLIQEGHIHRDYSPTGNEIVGDARLAAAEFSVFGILVAGLSQAPVEPLRLDGERAQAVVPTLNAGQTEALSGFSNFRFGVISGGAGVGKTYTMRAVCEVAEENGLRVALCAPTGKAAKKLGHATQREAKTIHRTLEPFFSETTGTFKFGRHAGNMLEADLVVVDEVSMVDVRLMRSLLEALSPSCRLLLVGDHHQIPSVGAGAVLRDLLSAQSRYPGAIHVLTEIVRQAGILARNTSALLDGVVSFEEEPAWGVQRTERGNEEGTAAIAATIVEAIVTSPEPLEPFGRELDFAWDVQVLSPTRKGPLGTYALNVHLQKLRQRLLGNTTPPEPTPAGRPPKPMLGDRIIWTVNDYELSLFNGTQAIVTGLPKGGGMGLFTEDGREVTIPSGKRKNVELAYAMTIHKSQGSEWPCVVLVASSAHWYQHDRNLLYTGASRASESLTILGDREGLQHFARERRSAVRQTFGGFLVHGWEPNGIPSPGWE